MRPGQLEFDEEDAVQIFAEAVPVQIKPYDPHGRDEYVAQHRKPKRDVHTGV